MKRHGKKDRFLLFGVLSAALVFLMGLLVVRCSRSCSERALSLTRPVRPEPATFPVRSHLPSQGEGRVCGSIDLSTFSPGRDLAYIDDPRVWWESDHDEGDTEDDHTIHRALEIPLRRLIELVAYHKGTLKVQDAYRPSGVHNPTSLHKEGRAVDVTCDELTLEKLAKLCWAAGFDWVFHENDHIHASVARLESE